MLLSSSSSASLLDRSSLGAEPDVCRIAVSAEAETDKTEGGELARLIADELRREKDFVIVDESHYLHSHK